MTVFDAGGDLRDVQIAARHADPRTAMRQDRTRKNLDRHLNYILADYMASRYLTCSQARRAIVPK
jgi:integrase/recombinase XerD